MRSFTCTALVASLALTISSTFAATLSDQQGVNSDLKNSIPFKSSINKRTVSQEPYYCADNNEIANCCQGCTDQSTSNYEFSVRQCYRECDPNYKGEGDSDSGINIDFGIGADQ